MGSSGVRWPVGSHTHEAMPASRRMESARWPGFDPCPWEQWAEAALYRAEWSGRR